MNQQLAKSLMVIVLTSLVQSIPQALAQEAISNLKQEELASIASGNFENELRSLDFTPIIPSRPLRPTPRPIPRCDIDPAVQKIDFQIIYKTTQFRGRVRITGVVKNAGRLRYVSGANQQAIYLYEDRNLVATMPFQNLEIGQTVSVSYERMWDASSPSEGEFPPEYKVVIGYDPDIYLDGNSLNDDCSTANNQIARRGTGINALF